MVLDVPQPPVDDIVAYLAAAAAPVAIKKIPKSLRPTQALLDDAVRAGRAWAWPKLRGAVRYWHSDPDAAIRNEALAAVAERAMTKAELVKTVARRAHSCGTKAADTAVKALIREGALAAAKTVGPTALLYDPRRAQALAEASLAIVRERLRKLDIDAACVAPAAVLQPAAPLADQILEAVARLQPGPMIPVTAPALRAALPAVSKAEFDACVLSLADGQKLFLTLHDHGWALPETEREQLVWDGGTKLYVAVTPRD